MGRLNRSVVAAMAMFLVVCVLPLRGARQGAEQKTGILLLAHGGGDSWNALVTGLAAQVNLQAPIEVAFGMAQRAAIQSGIDRLAQRGATRIVAVPLFVSSHSSVFTSSRYLLGAQDTMPRDLTMFAHMNHGQMNHEDGTKPVSATVPIRVANPLDHDKVVAEILTSRAREISRDPKSEVVVVVAHGPSPEEENTLWLKDMDEVAAGMRAATPFAGIEALTVRDDAAKAIRDAAADHLRSVVSKATNQGHRVLIVPLVISYGGIEDGIRDRLKGLTFDIATQGLLPDDRLVTWVLESADMH